MLHRGLIMKDCAAFIKCKFIQYISWDTDVSMLQCEEVFVEYLELFPIPVYFRHTFVGTTYTLGFCSVCKKSVFHGFICKYCNQKYHVRCILYCVLLCEHVKKGRAYYERSLAYNRITGLVQIPITRTYTFICKKTTSRQNRKF